ncbi:MAG TPA: SRPBCC family protein [Thermoanaerobaculia bacterium]|nr:SRPBCC family protein [Thermoanaerobaculia bacterium]
MKNINAWLTGIGLGALAASLLDPARGRRRRALVRDKAVHLGCRSRSAAGKTWRDARNRGIGLAHQGKRRVSERDLSLPRVRGPERQRMDLFQRQWAPATRTLMGALGMALLGLSVSRRGPLRGFLVAHGAALLTRSFANRPLFELFSRPEEPIVVQKTLHVDAPIEQVWELWEHPESFPRFMDHIETVEPLGDDTYRWVARGPAGIGVEWRARVVERRPHELVRWESLPGSRISTSGSVRFENGAATGHGGSRVHVRMSYAPPAGALGHLVARLFGDDPRSAMNADMIRLKSLLENGRATAHHHTVERGEVMAIH